MIPLDTLRDEILDLLEQRHAETVAIVREVFDAQQRTAEAEAGGQPEPAKQWQPRSALYRLALDAMRAFHADERRYPSVPELLDTMPIYDDGLAPITVIVDTERGVIRWRTHDGKRKSTRFRTFANQMGRLRAAVHASLTVSVGEE